LNSSIPPKGGDALKPSKDKKPSPLANKSAPQKKLENTEKAVSKEAAPPQAEPKTAQFKNKNKEKIEQTVLNTQSLKPITATEKSKNLKQGNSSREVEISHTDTLYSKHALDEEQLSETSLGANEGSLHNKLFNPILNNLSIMIQERIVIPYTDSEETIKLRILLDKDGRITTVEVYESSQNKKYDMFILNQYAKLNSFDLPKGLTTFDGEYSSLVMTVTSFTEETIQNNKKVLLDDIDLEQLEPQKRIEVDNPLFAEIRERQAQEQEQSQRK